jgi:putative restriction endonuclease
MVTNATSVHVKAELLDVLLDAVRESGWQCVVTEHQHPFGLSIFRADDPIIRLRVYIWNCTHGGGAARARDEFRIQFTPRAQTPKLHSGETTVLLGWHDGYSVFAGWSIVHHAGQAGSSPSAQVKESTLAAAHTKTFATQLKRNHQIVVAFKPAFFVDYAQTSDRLHGHLYTNIELAPLNDVTSINEEQVASIADQERRLIVGKFFRRFRAYDFRNRVLGAYGYRCAFCGIQLDLLDAAHVIPVADSKSTDETSNGVALCKLHHAAFDQNLVSFAEDYRIEVSAFEVSRLASVRRDGGLAQFRASLLPAIRLPADRRDYPPPAVIREARNSRGWRG